MEEAELYHRTFLRYAFDPRAGHYKCATGSCHDEIRKPKQNPFDTEPEFMRGEHKPTMPLQPFGQVFRTVRTSERPKKQQAPHPNQRRFSALQMTEGGSPQAITIIEKPDQRFIDHASQWELRWSAITQHGGRFQPVVDHNLTVIGQYGLVNGSELIRPEDGGLHILTELLEADIPVFVVNNPPIGTKKPVKGAAPLKPPDGWIELGLMRDQYLVIAAPDGQVVLGSLHKQGHSAQSVSTPFVALVVGEIVGRLGVKVLSKAFGMLMNKLASGARRLGGPTRILTEKFANKLRSMRAAKTTKHPKIRGDVDGTVAADNARELHQATRYAERPDVDQVFLGEEARKAFNAPASRTKFPDVVAKKKDGSYALGEGKGTDMKKVVEQFDAAGRNIRATGGRISEQEVVVPGLKKLDIDGQVVHSPGSGYGVDAQGFLINMPGPPPWPHQLANGMFIKVIVKP